MAREWPGSLGKGENIATSDSKSVRRCAGLLHLYGFLEWFSALVFVVAVVSRSIDLDWMPYGTCSFLDRDELGTAK